MGLGVHPLMPWQCPFIILKKGDLIYFMKKIQKILLVFLVFFCFSVPVFGSTTSDEVIANIVKVGQSLASGFNKDNYLIVRHPVSLRYYICFGASGNNGSFSIGSNGSGSGFSYTVIPPGWATSKAICFDSNGDYLMVSNSENGLDPRTVNGGLASFEIVSSSKDVYLRYYKDSSHADGFSDEPIYYVDRPPLIAPMVTEIPILIMGWVKMILPTGILLLSLGLSIPLLIRLKVRFLG